MCGMLDKFLTHKAFGVSGAVDVGSVEDNVDAAAAVAETDVNVLGKSDVWGFVRPLNFIYMFLLSLLLMLFGWPPAVLCHSL